MGVKKRMLASPHVEPRPSGRKFGKTKDFDFSRVSANSSSQKK